MNLAVVGMMGGAAINRQKKKGCSYGAYKQPFSGADQGAYLPDLNAL
jgi:hypothetical protein